MKYRIVSKVLGYLMLIIGLDMVPPLLIAAYTQEGDLNAFSLSLLVTVVVALLMIGFNWNAKGTIKTREGLAIVTMGWVFASVLGALPFYLSSSVPTYTDALFETISGFTTTGATIIRDIEILPKGILFWRSFTHWIGGMGILVVAVAILRALGTGGFHIFKAESPGPVADKIVPRIKDTAKILYRAYMAISLLEFVLLMLGGMSAYESAIHTFGTLGTGGFSTRNGSVGAFDSPYIIYVISIFMIMSGVNFSLYFALFKGKWKDVLRNSELKFYLGIILCATVAITISTKVSFFGNWSEALMHSLFQVASITTTTGYTTFDYEQWSTFAQAILFLLMFIGGSAGSTGGSIKVIRILVMVKLVQREFTKILHPRSVVPVKVGKDPVEDGTVINIASFVMLYIMIFILGTVLISLEGIGLLGAGSAVAATLGNIGPGFGFVGPTMTYAEFSIPSKLLLSFFMLLGRLELFTVLALFTPRFWKN